LTLVHTHEAGAYICDPGIVAGLSAAVASIGQPVRLLPSGAGHDTMIMGALCPAGMLFMRCKGGISHNPAESITPEDCEVGLAALMAFVRGFRPR
jgi:allantoate deiminase